MDVHGKANDTPVACDGVEKSCRPSSIKINNEFTVLSLQKRTFFSKFLGEGRPNKPFNPIARRHLRMCENP